MTLKDLLLPLGTAALILASIGGLGNHLYHITQAREQEAQKSKRKVHATTQSPGEATGQKYTQKREREQKREEGRKQESEQGRKQKYQEAWKKFYAHKPEDGLYLTPSSIQDYKKFSKIYHGLRDDYGLKPDYEVVRQGLGDKVETFYRILVKEKKITDLYEDYSKLKRAVEEYGMSTPIMITYEDGKAKKWERQPKSHYNEDEAKYFKKMKYYNLINRNAKENDLSVALLYAQIQQESNGFKERARSHKGARGLMQLMPGTAKELGVTDMTDPAQNIKGGTRYLKQQLDRFDDNVYLALAAYNAGPGNAIDKDYQKFKETMSYLHIVGRTAADLQLYTQQGGSNKKRLNRHYVTHRYLKQQHDKHWHELR